MKMMETPVSVGTPKVEQAFDFNSREVIVNRIGEMLEESKTMLKTLEEDKQQLVGGNDVFSDPGLVALQGGKEKDIFDQNLRILQEVKGLEVIKNGEAVILEDDGESYITGVHYGYAIRIVGQASEDGGKSFPVSETITFVPTQSFAGKEFKIGDEFCATISPSTPFGKQILRSIKQKEETQNGSTQQ